MMDGVSAVEKERAPQGVRNHEQKGPEAVQRARFL